MMDRDRAMSILEHLGEFKRRMIRVSVAFLVFTIIAAVFYDQIFEFLRKPAEDALAGADGACRRLQNSPECAYVLCPG